VGVGEEIIRHAPAGLGLTSHGARLASSWQLNLRKIHTNGEFFFFFFFFFFLYKFYFNYVFFFFIKKKKRRRGEKRN